MATRKTTPYYAGKPFPDEDTGAMTLLPVRGTGNPNDYRPGGKYAPISKNDHRYNVLPGGGLVRDDTVVRRPPNAYKQRRAHATSNLWR